LEKDKAWNEGWHAIKNQIPLARLQLEAELRTLLGGERATPEPEAG
jgi:hypothetical protein